jgi:hypothetical protein
MSVRGKKSHEAGGGFDKQAYVGFAKKLAAS